MKYLLTLLLFITGCFYSQAEPENSKSSIAQKFFELVVAPGKDKYKNLEYIKQNWEQSFPIMIIEVIYLSNDPKLNAELINAS